MFHISIQYETHKHFSVYTKWDSTTNGQHFTLFRDHSNSTHGLSKVYNKCVSPYIAWLFGTVWLCLAKPKNCDSVDTRSSAKTTTICAHFAHLFTNVHTEIKHNCCFCSTDTSESHTVWINGEKSNVLCHQWPSIGE